MRNEVACANAWKDYLRLNVEEVDGPLDTPCLDWTGYCRQGYGSVWYDGRYYLVHRLSCIVHSEGPIPVGSVVCHRCNNPRCVQFSHLRADTQRSNMLQMFEEGRDVTPTGEWNGHAVLSEVDVAVIKGLLLRPYHGLRVALARHYGVSKQAIHLIEIGKAWPHVKAADNPTVPWAVPIVRRRKIGPMQLEEDRR